MIISLDDRMGIRSIPHMNLLVAEVGVEQGIFEFAGNIPGAVTVLKEASEKNGKWSCTTWSVELTEAIVGAFVWHQDWEGSGRRYLTTGTWAAAEEEVRKKAVKGWLTDNKFEL